VPHLEREGCWGAAAPAVFGGPKSVAVEKLLCAV